MTDDARINVGLPSHPKTKKLLRRLGHAGPWGLVCLFLWTASNRSDGDLSGMSIEDIELASDWQGEEGQFVAALSSVGFLDGEDGAFSIHDWAEHNPWAAGKSDRSEASKWAALCKRYGRAGAADRMPDYAERMRPAHDPHAARTNPQCDPDAPLPLPSPLPKEQKHSSSGDDAKVAALDARLTEVTREAVETWNASELVAGGLASIRPTVGFDKRKAQVRRMLQTAREICLAETGTQTVTRQFWVTLWDLYAQDDFYAGRGQAGRGHDNWKPDFEFLTRPATVLKLYDKTAEAEHVAH